MAVKKTSSRKTGVKKASPRKKAPVKKTGIKKRVTTKAAGKKTAVKKTAMKKKAVSKKQPVQQLPEREEITFSVLWETLKDFLKEFKTPIAWMFVVMALIFATKSLEVILALRNMGGYQPPLFKFLSGFFKDIGGIFAHPASHFRYLRRIPAIFYQMVIPVLVLWFIYFKTKLINAAPLSEIKPSFFLKLKQSFGLMSRDYGLSPAPLKQWSRSLLFIFLIMLPFIVIFASTPTFKKTYPYLLQLKQLRQAGQQFTFNAIMLFILFQIIRAVYMFSWEFLFRGFMLNALRDKYKYHAIFIQTIPYVLLHSTKSSIELYYTIPGGLLLGLLAYRTKSIWPGFLLHAGGAIIFDMVAMYF